jgi:hypothetical protein
MLNEIETCFFVDGGCIENAIYLIMEYERNKIFKSTLVSQFNTNPFLFKDRFNMSEEIHVFQNLDVYLITASFGSTFF